MSATFILKENFLELVKDYLLVILRFRHSTDVDTEHSNKIFKIFDDILLKVVFLSLLILFRMMGGGQKGPLTFFPL